MNDGTVSVELKLLLDSLRKQAREAAVIIQSALKSNSEGPGGAVTNQQKHTKAVKETVEALKQQKKAAYDAAQAAVDGFRRAREEQERMHRMRNLPLEARYKFDPAEQSLRQIQANKLRAMRAARSMTGAAGFLADIPQGLGGPAPAGGGPVPPIIPPPVIGASGASAGGAAAGAMGALKLLPGAAMLGAAITGLRSAVQMISYAFQKLLIPLRMYLRLTEQASRLYASSTLSGTSLGFQAYKSTAAGVLGVSEDQVFHFAKTLKLLNHRLDEISKTTASANRPLTMANWEWKMLNAQITASASAIASELTPAFLGFTRSIALMVEHFGKYMRMQMFFLNMLIENANPLLAIMSKIGGTEAPAVSPSMNRMASSSWERMGLVIGNRGQSDSQKTADNTKRIYEVLFERLPRFSAPAYVPAGATGGNAYQP